MILRNRSAIYSQGEFPGTETPLLLTPKYLNKNIKCTKLVIDYDANNDNLKKTYKTFIHNINYKSILINFQIYS